MSKKEDVSKCWRFGQIDYSVTISVDGNVLSIEVEDSLAADVWRATFDPKRKTRQFNNACCWCACIYELIHF